MTIADPLCQPVQCWILISIYDFSRVLPFYAARHIAQYSESQCKWRRWGSSWQIVKVINTSLTKLCFMLRTLGQSHSAPTERGTKLSYFSAKICNNVLSFLDCTQKNVCIEILCLRWYDFFVLPIPDIWSMVLLDVSMRCYHFLLFFGQTNNGNMWKESLCYFVYEHTAGCVCVSSLFMAFSFSVTKWQQNSWSNCKLFLSLLYYPSCCLQTNQLLLDGFL